MRLDRLWLTDFRSYREAELTAPDGLTVIGGPNGAGKTNVLEAIGYLSGLRSFRGAPTEALVRQGAERAIVRAEAHSAGRELLIEAEISPGGRARAQINRQRTSRRRDLLDVFRISVFTPDDLALVKGGPGERRRLLDDALVLLHPADDGLRLDLERIVRQRNALLKQARGRLTDDVAVTLDVWDTKLAEVGERLRERREALVRSVAPAVEEAYERLAGRPTELGVDYAASWEGSLPDALQSVRDEDVRRRQTGVGPHRDDLVLTIDGLPARTQASQGEQRSLALALRLAVHLVATEHIGTAPILLLDDVFSELDPDRSRALVDQLPAGQAFLTTASGVPEGVTVAQWLSVRDGVLEPGR